MTEKNLKDIESMTNAELIELINTANDILYDRKEERQDELIANFKKAYDELLELNISVTYCGGYSEYNNMTFLDVWDNFKFK
jgi:hypothetical protein